MLGPTVLTVSGFTPAVPELSTWAMMIIGVGFVGFAMRRKAFQAASPTFA
ncbi:PEPxxWA-CTERM sorting domain-containing protein [Novosphingobium chloroacetimidivorans]